MKRVLPIAAGLAVIVSAGIAQGVWTNRWSRSRDLDQAIARLDRVAARVGGWEGHDLELDAGELEAAGIEGHVARRYVSRSDGSAVTVLLVAGRPGPISVHTPEICYAGAGYKPEAAPARYAPPSGLPRPVEFWMGRFREGRSAAPMRLRILWAWGSQGSWGAPDQPRLAYAPRRSLYKLYVISESAPGDDRPDAAADSFVHDLMPELQRALFSGF